MSAKKKAASPKENWQATRRRYTWYLRPPFKTQFDRTHWWKGKRDSDIEPIAALYELARRHPFVGETPLMRTEPFTAAEMLRLPPLSQRSAAERLSPLGRSILEPKLSLRYTIRYGFKSWPKLTGSEQTEWKSSLRNLKGFDFRPEQSRCHNLTSFALSSIYEHREHGPMASLPFGLGGPGWLHWNPTDDEWKEAIAEAAVQAHREGYVLLAVAPDLAPDKLRSAVAKNYRNHLRLYPPAKPVQRARVEQWLPLIADFEDAEAGRQKQTRQQFIRFRRALEGLSFT